MKLTIAIAALAGIAGAANAGVTINEVLGSTTGSDLEFIELYNTTGAAIDLTGWTVSLYDSDLDAGGSGWGGADGFGTANLSGSIGAGGYYTLANSLAFTGFGFTPDQVIGSNSIENSSYTMILRNGMGDIVESIFVEDAVDGSDPEDLGNAATDGSGDVIDPDFTIAANGNFLPAGFYRFGDGSSTFELLEFAPQPAASATPGGANLPAPGALALLGLGGLAANRRRR